VPHCISACTDLKRRGVALIGIFHHIEDVEDLVDDVIAVTLTRR
jgi:alpha-D-ribose 1-methylphosphonate 5-triphosphate synthase subunit PhnL